jgi:MFS family permease
MFFCEHLEQGATATVLCFGLGNFFGLLVGGAGGRFLYKLDPRFPALLAGSSAILGCIPFWLLLTTVNDTRPSLYIGVVAVLAGLGSGVTGPIVKATLTNVTLPTARGQAFAIFNLFDDFGRGLGPVFVFLLIHQMGGRTPAFNLGVLGWVVCGIMNSLTYFTVARDERKVQATLAASLHHESCANSDRATNSSEFV